MKTPEQCVKSVQSWQQRHKNVVIDVVLVALLFIFNIFYTLLRLT